MRAALGYDRSYTEKMMGDTMSSTMPVVKAHSRQSIDDAIDDVMNDPQMAYLDYDKFSCETRDGSLAEILVIFAPLSGEITEVMWRV